MRDPESKIVFTVLYAGDEYIIHTFSGEYRDLKTLIQDRLYLEDFGQCGGMGRCATCLIEIGGPNGYFSSFRRNEATTINRLSPHLTNVRLSCQIEIDSNLANSQVKVLEKI